MSTTLMYERRRRRIRDEQVLPEEIFFNILARLPVKSLLQCRCVCHSWNTSIRSPDFISAHLETSVMKKACDYLLIETSKRDCFSICCAETFSKCLDVKVPLSYFYVVIGSCNGLLCMSDFISIYLLNPSIRRIKRLPVGVIQDTTYVVAIGFGFHRSQNDYKVVRVMRFEPKEFEVEVYSLRLKSWRRISAVPPVSYSAHVWRDECAFLNGVVYWSTREPFQGSTFILSFDFGSEEFRRIMLPHEVRIMLHHVRTSFEYIHIRVFEKSLSFFHRRRQDGQPGWFYDVWDLEMDTWKKTCTILLPERGCVPSPLAFTGNGRFLMVMTGTFSKGPYLVLYDHEAHQTINTGIKMMKPCGCGYVDADIREEYITENLPYFI